MKTRTPHDHDRGLQYDLEVMAECIKQRRRVLGWMLSGGAAVLVASCGGDGNASSSGSGSSDPGSGGGSSGGSSSATCVANAEETAGPYPADGSNTVNGMASNILTENGVIRSGIRSSFGSSATIAPGLPLTLTLSILNSNLGCAPLSGYAVYLWHCTREGDYSLYSRDIQSENYLRGVQVTDSNGQVTFQTIFPGCYAGRYPHIHFEVYPSLSMATLYTNKVLTSQIALPRDICTTVYSGDSGYSRSASNLGAVSIERDNVFGDNTAEQIAQMTASLSGTVAAGYTGSIIVGVPA